MRCRFPRRRAPIRSAAFVWGIRMESWMRLGCRCTSWSLRQTIACGRQPRVPRVECRFSGWIFRPVARRAVHQLARAVLRGDGDGAVAGRACSVWLSLVLAICVRWRQARFSETHAFDRRALAQALRREVARLHRVEQGAASAALHCGLVGISYGDEPGHGLVLGRG